MNSFTSAVCLAAIGTRLKAENEPVIYLDEMPDNLPESPDHSLTPTDAGPTPRQRALIIAGALVLVLLLAGVVLLASVLVSNPAQTETIRDVVIIFMALEFLFVGLAMIVLIVQLARLTALIQNEVRPILDSTNETVSTLRGTTTFLSEHLVSPVVRANSSMAAVRRAIDLLRVGRIR